MVIRSGNLFSSSEISKKPSFGAPWRLILLLTRSPNDFIQAGRNGTQRAHVREESARDARRCVRARACVWSKGRRVESVKPLARGLLQRRPERDPGRPRSKSRGFRRREGWVEHRARRLERRPRRREGNKYERGKVVLLERGRGRPK